MKYLLSFLEDIPDAPKLADPEFQQLLVEVQAGKGSNKSSADAFYDSLEKIVNELKSTPESLAFQKPVSKRDAPDYYEVIKKPMDLSSILRNVKARKYKNKAEFVADLDLIWSNCFEYNSQETHPIRISARFMQQKADYHLNFLVDKNERVTNPLQDLLPQVSGPTSGQGSSANLGHGGSGQLGTDEDAAGESDDAMGEDGTEGRKGKSGSTRRGTPGTARDRRGTSVLSVSGDRRANGTRVNGVRRQSPASFRPNLQTNLDAAPALIRTPYTMTHFLPVSLNQAGPSFSDKGKAKEILYGNAPPAWYPAPPSASISAASTAEEEDARLEGYWWTAMSQDEAYVGGLPAVPVMPLSDPPRRKRARRRIVNAHSTNGTMSGESTLVDGSLSITPPSSLKQKSLRNVVHRTVEKLYDSRQVVNRIQDFQRVEMEGGMIPSRVLDSAQEKAQKVEDRAERKRKRKIEKAESIKRKKTGGVVGEEEAVLVMKRASAGLLAHAGFEGANESALDLFTRATVDHLQSMGKTFRLLLDGFSKKMSSEEIILHALHENGQVDTQELEAHIKDEIERESIKVAEMQRKVRQAFREVATAPVIEDDMMFANNGEMLLDGNFADELGEDFLGLRDMGIDKEFGLSSLTVPASLFHGRRRRGADSGALGLKEDQPDYPPPPPFIPLNPTTLPTHLPALLHAFFASRIESGLTLADDEGFDPAHSQIGSLGQIVSKPVAVQGATSKKKVVNVSTADKVANGEGGDEDVEEKKKKVVVKKNTQPGVGKGNWIRPSKEEKARRAAEKEKGNQSTPIGGAATNTNGNTPNISVGGDGDAEADAVGEEDAEGEEE